MKYLNKKTNKRRKSDEKSVGKNEQSSIAIQKEKKNLLKQTADLSFSNNPSCLNVSEGADNNLMKMLDNNDSKVMKRVVSSNDIQKRRARKSRHIFNVLLCLNLVFFL
jgi:hypothetical protein